MNEKYVDRFARKELILNVYETLLLGRHLTSESKYDYYCCSTTKIVQLFYRSSGISKKKMETKIIPELEINKHF